MAKYSWTEALKTAVANWDPSKHPRGRDGKFLETGQMVRVFSGPSGPQIATGMIVASHFAPDGRMFIGVRTPANQTEWYRPKQIEHLTVKATLAPGEGVPSMPLPAVDSKDADVNWDSGPLGGGVPVGDMLKMTPDFKVDASTLDPASLEALGTEGPAPYPPHPQVAEQPETVKIPDGKTPEDILGLIVTSAMNKGLADEQFNADFQKMIAEDDPQKAHALLATLMTKAKLGGKQRKRYKAVLDKHLASEGAVDIEPAPVAEQPDEDFGDLPSTPADLLIEILKEQHGTEDAIDYLSGATVNDVKGDFPEWAPNIDNAEAHDHITEALDSLQKEWEADNPSEPVPTAEQIAADLVSDPNINSTADAVAWLAEATVESMQSAGWNIPDGAKGESLLVDALDILSGDNTPSTPTPEPAAQHVPKPGDVYHNAMGHTMVAIGGGGAIDFYDFQDVYKHPSGSVIVVDWANNVTKFSGTTGKKSSTSATWDKLESGHGAWQKLTPKPTAGSKDPNPVTQPKKAAAAKKSAAAKKPKQLIGEIEVGNTGTLVPVYGGESVYQTAGGSTYVVKSNGTVDSYSGVSGDLVNSGSMTFGQLFTQLETAGVDYVEITPGKESAVTPEPDPWPGTTVINIPAGKTPADLLGMMGKTIQNKVGEGPDTTIALSTLAKLVDGPNQDLSHEEAQKSLAQLMSTYGFGGNQRKRYRSLLAMIYGVPVGEKQSAPTTSVEPTPAGKLPRMLTDTPKGPGVKVLNAAAANKAVNPQDMSAQQAKARIQVELNKRLADVPIQDFIRLSKSPNFNSSQYSKQLASAVEGMIKNNVKEYKGYKLSATLGSYQLVPADGASVSLAEMENALRMTETNALIRIWAGTSNDANPRSLAMQRAAKEEFGLTHTYDWPGEHTDAKIADEYAKYGLVFRRFLREMHTSTQQWLKTQGVTHVRLVRGVKHKSGFADKVSSGTGIVGSVKMRPMSSFSSNRNTSNGFAGRYGGNSAGTVFWAYVPIERIVGSAVTGFGCQNEYEFVVLAGDADDRVWIT